MTQEVAYLSPLVSPGQGLISFDSDKRGRLRASNTRHALVNILQYCNCDCILKQDTLIKASLTKMRGLMCLLNNYWMTLSMISWIIETEVSVICRSRRLRQITQTRGFDNSWYHAKPEFNNCFIIHFSHNSSSETEAKRSAILFLREHSKGLSNQTDVEPDMINAISAADIAFIMSSSQAIVNWLNALDQSDFSKWVWCIIINYSPKAKWILVISIY